MRALSDTLWHERDMLTLLVHRLEVERALLETNRAKRLALAARETETILADGRLADLSRATEAAASARVLGLPGDASLADIARLAPPPWDEILQEHRTQLRTLVAEITALTGSLPGSEAGEPSERLLGSVRDTLDDLVEDAAGAESSAEADVELTEAVIELQLQEITRRAVEAREYVVQRGLEEFLR